MPNSVTPLVLVERATKCLATWAFCARGQHDWNDRTRKFIRRQTHVLGRLKEPRLCALGVGDSLLSGEGLARNDEEGGLAVAAVEDLGEVGAVNVADKVHLEVALRVVLESLADHDGTEV